MTDPRVKQFNDKWFELYKNKYTITPIWSEKDWGVNGKIAKNLWTWADKNHVNENEIYQAMSAFFSEGQSHSHEVFYKIVTEMVSKVRHANQIVEKAKRMFESSRQNLEDRTRVIERTEVDLMNQMRELWTNDEEGCLAWCKGQRFTQNTLDGLKDVNSKVYMNWTRNGQLARKYFGNDLLDKCWKSSAPVDEKKRKELLKKQKELLTNSQSHNTKGEV